MSQSRKSTSGEAVIEQVQFLGGRLCSVVDEALELYLRNGKPLPPPTRAPLGRFGGRLDPAGPASQPRRRRIHHPGLANHTPPRQPWQLPSRTGRRSLPATRLRPQTSSSSTECGPDPARSTEPALAAKKTPAAGPPRRGTASHPPISAG